MARLLNHSSEYINFSELIPSGSLTASAPCRLDMGGTLDIATIHLPLRSFQPVTMNLALDLRTRICLSPHETGRVKVSSRGFDSADFRVDDVPFDHPLGLMFASVAYFGVQGIHIHIDSSSPPKSGLGGSSVAAVALVAALARLDERRGEHPLDRHAIAMLAHAIESGVSMVPCGIQDQLAAAYGGVNAWEWCTNGGGTKYTRQVIVAESEHQRLQQQILLAYTGVPHVSSDINGQWLRQFLSGNERQAWREIITCTRRFVQALDENNISSAVAAMNAEVAIRRKLTPAVLGPMGEQLLAAAIRSGCGARFTGAGGGGCIWALGDIGPIRELEPRWRELLSTVPDAHLIEHSIDDKGVVV